MANGYAALIRGIHVGGHNAISMKALSGLFVEAGCSDVRTYIQSGNVVFSATAKLSASLPRLIGGQIAKQLGRELDLSVVIRSLEELDQLIADNPFPAASESPKLVHVGFLEAAPAPAKVALLDARQSATDRFEVRGKQLYLYTPEGYGRSKLTMSFFSKLGTPCTMRNWNTVLELQSLLASA